MSIIKTKSVIVPIAYILLSHESGNMLTANSKKIDHTQNIMNNLIA
jgi:hypothetical protein